MAIALNMPTPCGTSATVDGLYFFAQVGVVPDVTQTSVLGSQVMPASPFTQFIAGIRHAGPVPGSAQRAGLAHW